MSFRTLMPGRAYSFLYPSHNFEHVHTGLEPRRIVVERVRDTEMDPIEVETLNLNRFLRRGRWLVTGRDLDKYAERSFYVESMIAVVEIDVVSPEERVPVYLVGHKRFASEREAVAAATNQSRLTKTSVAVCVTHAPFSARQTVKLIAGQSPKVSQLTSQRK